ncbi:MAG TPA: hypothetical protein EYG03_20275 [Planctomycetes bacterium]|nr:hypothetical protein [Fuerstiella sp.]HIK94288.1 hypothetical protein [Planctomycetota bacterium]
MRRSAQAKGIQHENTTIPTETTETTEHWLFDPDQLVNWQGELVSSCHAINEQLGQIKDDLRVNTADDVAPGLRVVGRPSVGVR